MNLSEEALITLDDFYNKRLDKFKALKNNLTTCLTENESLYCDTLIFFLYAQLEGFVTESLTYYLEIINSQKLKVKDTIYPICASSKCNQFESYEEYIKNPTLSKYEGRIKFVDAINNFWEHVIDIPISIVNTKNNLKQKILNDLMLKLGFPSEKFSKIGNILDNFVNTRNDIAHGNEQRTKLTLKKYEQFEDLVIQEIMHGLKDIILDSVTNQSYLLSKTESI